MEPVTIGVLALQGAFAKHAAVLSALGIRVIEVRKPEDLAGCHGLIIPGGESTAILKHIHYIGLAEAFQEFVKKKPVFGTCAGLILMSHKITSDSMEPFNLIDIEVQRNAFGRQADSFKGPIELLLNPRQPVTYSAMFIRAPRIKAILSPEVKVLGTYNGEPVLVQQGIHLGATFHPELTANPLIHAYFLNIVKKA